MNPRAGDTVISTKSNATSNTNPPTTTVMMTTKITTGQRATGRPAAAAAAGGSTSRASTRKRGRQQAEEPPHRPAKAATTRATTMARPEATVVQPPEKSRRRSDPRRLGDFFSNLASRMRGPKAADATRCQENEDNRQNGATEVVPIVSMKREVNSESAENMDADFNKRRKIEHDEPGDVSSCDSASSHNSVSPDVDSIKIDESDSAIVYSDSDLISSENLQIRNTDKAAENSVNFKIEKYETTAAVSKCNSGESSTQEITKDSENAEQIIDMCRSIVASMCEKIQEASGDSNASRTRANSPEPRSAKITLSSNTICIEDSSVEPSECHQQPGIKVVIDEDKDPTESPSATMRPSRSLPRRDEATRLRKNIQWMEEGARRLREELAEVRSQLHEERRAAKLARREFETAVRETRNAEATRHGQVIAELKARLSQSPSRAAVDSAPSTSKSELLKDENHRREVAALKKRLAEAEATIQKLKTNTLERAGRGTKRRNTGDEGPSTAETRKLEIEVQTLRAANKMLEERLHIAEESARARAAELRMQHESHETELSTLQKALRSDTIKMMDEIQSKNREIEKLERLVSESAQTNEKLRAQEGETVSAILKYAKYLSCLLLGLEQVGLMRLFFVRLTEQPYTIEDPLL